MGKRADRRKPGAVQASGVDGMVTAAPAERIELYVAAGLPAFCEKPVTRDSDEAGRLARRVAHGTSLSTT